jgi:cyclophilin family peptidyl-prolyl cis-trans isomerase/protein-disulfide isomerase
VVAAVPTADPTVVAAFPPITNNDWSQGPDGATMTILEYSDYQCPACGQAAPVIAQLLKEFPQDVRLVYRHFPLPIHDKSRLAAQAAEAAGLQGKFWEMHDLLFAKQADWSGLTIQAFKDWAGTQAAALGMNKATFLKDLDSSAVIQKVDASATSATQTGINYTPFLLINGLPYQGRSDHDGLVALLNFFKLGEHAFKACPPSVIDPSKHYVATLHTERGDVVIELFADKAPLTVNSFVYLAQQGWFDGMPFHRVISGFVAQTGDPSGSGMGGPGYELDDEINAGLKFDKEGVVGMANGGPNTNGSQFFITYGPQSSLDGKYTIFGQVTSGMDALKALQVRDPQSDATLAAPDHVLKVSITTR